jgi:hypothetical protein
LVIPNCAARRFMARTNAFSSPPTFSARATATSFADTTATDRIAAPTLIDRPAANPSFEGGCRAPRRVITSLSPGRSLPAEIASKVNSSVIILVRDAGGRTRFASDENSVEPLFASKTISDTGAAIAGTAQANMPANASRRYKSERRTFIVAI